MRVIRGSVGQSLQSRQTSLIHRAESHQARPSTKLGSNEVFQLARRFAGLPHGLTAYKWQYAQN